MLLCRCSQLRTLPRSHFFCLFQESFFAASIFTPEYIPNSVGCCLFKAPLHISSSQSKHRCKLVNGNFFFKIIFDVFLSLFYGFISVRFLPFKNYRGLDWLMRSISIINILAIMTATSRPACFSIIYTSRFVNE